jgi:hypothetical protein
MDYSLEPETTIEIIDRSWMERMRQHYQETGEVSDEDAARLLGDPRRGVYMRQTSEGQSSEHFSFD